MERWQGKVAIVTGASSGIGAAIAEKLVEHGMKVVGCARRSEVIEQNAKKLAGKPGKLYARSVDMTKEEDILAAFKWAEDNLGTVHVLVNNAAILGDTGLVDGDTKVWKQLMDTNVLGVVIATREAYKSMAAAGVAGHVVNINSIGGHMKLYVKNCSLYSPSKHAITCYTEMLRQELNMVGSKTKVTSISPGAVDTEIFSKASQDIRDMVKAYSMLKPEDIADAVIYTLGTPPHVQIHEIMIKPVGEIY